MIRDFACNQGNELDNVADVQMRAGICFALSSEWCISVKRGVAFDFHAVFYRMVARQRAYNMTYENRIRGLQGNQYVQFFQAAEPPSYQFMADQVRHQGFACNRQQLGARAIRQAVQGAVGAGSASILGFFGVDGGANWGHATAVGRGAGAGARPLFFDPNQGQYSLPAATNADLFAKEVLHNIDSLYGLGTIRDFVLYTVT